MQRLPAGATIEVKWSSFGSPETEGTYQCAALGGVVSVDAKAAATAKSLGGDPIVSLYNAAGATDSDNYWTVTRFTGDAAQMLN